MSLTPSYDAFEAGFTAGRNQVVYARLAADLDTPVSLMLKLTAARKDSFMLESVPRQSQIRSGFIPMIE